MRQYRLSVLLFSLFCSFTFCDVLWGQGQETSPAQKPKAASSIGNKKAQTKPRAATTPKVHQLSNDDVISFVKSGFSDDFIIDQIKSNQRDFVTTPAELMRLKAAGVSERVIHVMIDPTKPVLPVSIREEPPLPAVAPAPVPVKPLVREIKIPDGTEVKLRLSRSMSSSTAKTNDRVELEATGDIVIDDIIVIKKGAPGLGRVVEAQPKKSFGRSGKLSFTIDTVKSADGQNIRLRTSRSARGNENYGKAGVVTILTGPFGAFVKGKDVEIAAGTEYTIYIDEERTIRLKTED